MMRRLPLLTLAVALLACLTAAPASAGTRGPAPGPTPSAAAFDFSGPVVPMRDVVRDYATASSSRKLARAGVDRYPVHDGTDRTVAISVTPACATGFPVCDAANPQTIADFLGTLAHGNEITSLTVQLTTDPEIAAECGSPGALPPQACYFPSQERMVISGNDTTGTDGATREFVLAHEYGHHVANNRVNTPFVPTISFGTRRWATYEGVCQGVAAGTYSPGSEDGAAYYRNPGEAFAESFAFNRFPDAPVQWAWIDSLKPDSGAYAAITADTVHPWSGPVTSVFSRRFNRRGRGAFARRIATPLDGNFAIRLTGPRRTNFNLLLRSGGKVMARSLGRGSNERITATICGSRSATAVVRRVGRSTGRVRLSISRP